MSIKSDNLIEVSNLKAGQRVIQVDGKWVAVGVGGRQASGSADTSSGMVAGVLVESNTGNLMFQELAFDGTTPSNVGDPVSIEGTYLYNTGKDEPDYGGSSNGGSMASYKCTSVDINNKTWTGYLYDTATKTFSETLTEGLSYDGFPMPTIGHIYTEDATLELTIMTALSAYWSQLSADIQSGKYTTANLGDIIEVSNTALDDVGLAAGTLQFEIVAIDNADLVEERAHSITVMSKKVLFKSAMGGLNWGDTSIRAYLQESFINCLEPSCMALIAKVNRTLYKRGGGSTTVQDTVFLPSYTEMGGGDNEGITEGTQFDKMTSDSARMRDMNGAEHYFLSSASVGSSDAYRTVHQSGAFDWYYSSHGICPAFVLV